MKTKRSLVRRLARGFAFSLLTLVALVVALIGFLHTSPGHEVLRARLEKRLGERVTGTITIRALTFGLRAGLRMEGISIKDKSGAEAIAIGELRLVPNFRDIASGRTVLDALSLGDVNVTIVQNADGTTNLTGLIIRKPITFIAARNLDLRNVSIHLQKPDRSTISVEGISIHGSVEARPTESTFDVALSEVNVRSFALVKEALELRIADFAWGAKIAIVRGAGEISLAKLSANLVLKRDGVAAPFSTPIALGPSTVAIAPGDLGASLHLFDTAVLAMQAVELRVVRDGDRIVGEPKLTTAGIRIVADAVNRIVGRAVLASDVEIDLAVSGAVDHVPLRLTIRTAGGTAKLEGSLDLRNAAQLGYDVRLALPKFESTKLLANPELPPIVLEGLSIAVRGQGTTKETANATVTLDAGPIAAKGLTIDKLHVEATFANGRLDVRALDIRALGQSLSASGSYVLESKAIDVDLEARAKIAQALDELFRAGIGKSPSPIVRALATPGAMKIHVDGIVGRGLHADVRSIDLSIAGASAHVTGSAALVFGDPAKGEKKIRAESIAAQIDLRSLSLAKLAELQGRKPTVNGVLNGSLTVRGTVDAPELTFAIRGLLGDEASGRSRPELALHGNAGRGAAHASVTIKNSRGGELASARVSMPLAGKTLNPNGAMDVVLDVPRTTFAEIAPLLPEASRTRLAALMTSELELHARIGGTPASPRGTLNLDVEGPLAKLSNQKVSLVVTIDESGGATRAKGDLAIALGPGIAPITARGEASFARSPLVDRTAKPTWTAHVDIPEVDVAKLPLPPEKVDGLSGQVSAIIDAHGGAGAIFADVSLSTTRLKKGSLRALDSRLEAHLDSSGTRANLHVTSGDLSLIDLTLRSPLRSEGFVESLRDGASPPIDADLTLAEHSAAEWGRAIPALADLAGNLGGKVHVGGTIREPRATGGVRLFEIPMLDGSRARANADIDISLASADLTIALADKVQIRAHADTKEFLDARKNPGGGEVPITWSIGAQSIDLRSILPASASLAALGLTGNMRSDLGGRIVLAVTPDGRSVSRVEAHGGLALDGCAFTIPKTTRRLTDVALEIAARDDSVAIERLTARESDRDVAERALNLSGRVSLRDGTLSAALKTKNFLAFGGNFGLPDAPRAALTSDLGITANLIGDARRVRVDVRALTLWSPDRFARSHHQEVLSLGDVLELKDGIEIGMVAPPAKKTEPALANTPAAAPGKPLLVTISIPKPVRLRQFPLDLMVHGEVVIAKSAQGDRSLSGALVADDGSLYVAGKPHVLHHGEIRFEKAGPFLDLHFRRHVNAAAMRDFATEGNEELYAHMTGPFGKQRVSFSGVADGLFDAIAVGVMGRTRVAAGIDSQASASPQLPQIVQIRQTAFMSANLPHLAFLDRFDAYADPSASRTAYGRIETMTADSYSNDGARRFRVSTRSPTIGQSDAEVEYDFVMTNTPRSVAGVGIVGGTRGGGGPTIFWEWSSRD